MIASLVLGQFPPPHPEADDTPAEREKNLIPSFSSASLPPLMHVSSWKGDRGWIKTAKKMTSEVGKNHRQKNQQQKNTHIHQDTESKSWLTRTRLWRGKRGQWGNKSADRRVPVHTTRLSSPNCFCHVAVRARLSHSGVGVKGKPPMSVLCKNMIKQESQWAWQSTTPVQPPPPVCCDSQAAPSLTSAKRASQIGCF